MSSLYTRATPSQSRVLRAVEGACKNACDAHPDLDISPRHRRSIAKRAAGTLTSQWPDVLALQERQKAVPSYPRQDAPDGYSGAKCHRRRGSHFSRSSPLRTLKTLLAKDIGQLKCSGQIDRAEAFIHVLRLCAKLQEPDNGR